MPQRSSDPKPKHIADESAAASPVLTSVPSVTDAPTGTTANESVNSPIESSESRGEDAPLLSTTVGRRSTRRLFRRAGKPRTPGKPSRSRIPKERAKELEILWAHYGEKPGDDTRNALVEAYQFLLKEIVRRFAMRLPRTVDRGDLQTASNVGLMRAIESFDPTRGVRFESYCELRVKGALLDELRSQDWLPRPFRHRIELHKRVLEALRSEKKREPCDYEVAREMDMDLGDYQQLFGTGLPGQPAGSMYSGDEEDSNGLDVVPDPAVDVPGERLTQEELLKLVAQRLTDQESRIVYLKYWEELPMREIGQLSGLSESRVCKIHARLLERLKDRFRVS